MIGYRRIFLDTNPIIYRIEDNPSFRDIVEKFLIDNGNADYITSTITITEYFVFPLKENRQDFIEAFNAFIENMGVDIIDINKKIAYKAAQIRAQYKGFKPMDALQLAAAVESGCDVFLTNDKKLRQFTGIKVLTMEDI